MEKREVKEISNVKNDTSFKTISLKCEQCGANLEFRQSTTEGLLFDCPNCEVKTLVKSSPDDFIREYISNIQSSSDEEVINARETTLDSLDDGTRETSSIKKEESDDLTIGDRLLISGVGLAAATGLWFAADWFRHLAWEGKGDIFYLLGIMSALGILLSGWVGLNFLVGIEDGALFHLSDAKKDNEIQPEKEEEQKINLGR